jgi:hypothetical protein
MCSIVDNGGETVRQYNELSDQIADGCEIEDCDFSVQL